MADADLLGLHTVFTSEGGAELAAQIQGIGAVATEAGGGVAVLDTALDGLKSTVLELLPVISVAAGVMKVFTSTDEAQQAANQLAVAYRNVGLSVENYRDAIDGLGTKLKAYGYTQAETEAALARLTLITGNAGQAFKSMQVAADLAAFAHVSLTQAANVLGRAFDGSTVQLTRWGLLVKGAKFDIDALATRLAGQAGAQADTLGGALSRINAALTEFATKIGFALAKTNDYKGFADKIIATLDKWSTATSTVVDNIENIIGKVGALYSKLKEIAANPLVMAVLSAIVPGMQGAMALAGAAGHWLVTPSHEKAANDEIDAMMAEYKKLFGGGTGKAPPNTGTMTDPNVKALNDNLAGLSTAITGDVGDVSEQRQKALDAAREQIHLGEERLKINSADLEALQQILAARTQLDKLLNTGLLTQKQSVDAVKLEADATADTLGKAVKSGAQADESDKKGVLFNYGQTMGNAVTAGLEAALGKGGKLKNVFGALGKSIVAQLGELMSQLGQVLLQSGSIFIGLSTAMAAGGILASGPAQVAAGVALVALGSALGSVVSGGGSGGTPSFAGLNIGGSNTTQYLTPNPNSPYAAGTQYPGIVQPVFNVIGPGDASAQSQIGVLLNNMARRGITAPGIAG